MSLDIELIAEDGEVLFEQNITHNLGRMADKAGIYDCVWRPDEHGFVRAHQIIEPLREGYMKLIADPQKYEQFNSENGWGMYEHFVPFCLKYLQACMQYPDALVRVSR